MLPSQTIPFYTYLAELISLTLILFAFGISIFHHVRRKRRQMKDKSFQDEYNMEADRKRIAADLHDDFGSLLTGLKFSLTELAREDPSNSLLLTSSEQLSLSMSRLRDISLNLLPRELEKEGLNAAIESLADRINETKRIRVSFSSLPEVAHFDNHKAMLLFRVIQEITTNAIKHSGAGSIDIGIAKRGNHLILEIRDDGSGFDFEAACKKKYGSGLKNIQSRLDLLNGVLVVESGRGPGTHYFIKIPMQQLTNGSK